MKNIPDHLHSTHDLIKRTFPKGVSQSEYQVLIYLLYEHLSDRNLIEILSFITQKDIYLVSNDIPQYYKGQNISPELINEIKLKLNENGFQDWLGED